MHKRFLHAWKGSSEIVRMARFSESGLHFAGGLCYINGHLVPCICVSLFFEDNPWAQLLPEHMHLAEKIKVWSEALAHLWL